MCGIEDRLPNVPCGGAGGEHRSYLVNPDRVLEIAAFFGGTYALRIDDAGASEVPVIAVTCRWSSVSSVCSCECMDHRLRVLLNERP
jgi:hypothetical protein